MIRKVSGVVCLFLVLQGCAIAPQGADLSSQQQALQLIDLGVLQLRCGKLQQAQASFEVAYQLNSSAQALDGLGAVAFLGGEISQAKEYFLAAISLEPEYAEAYANLGLLMEASQNYKEAQLYYRRSIELAPHNFRARNNLAALMREQQLTGKGVDRQSVDTAQVRQELFRAQSISPNGLIEQNLYMLGERDEKGD